MATNSKTGKKHQPVELTDSAKRKLLAKQTPGQAGKAARKIVKRNNRNSNARAAADRALGITRRD